MSLKFIILFKVLYITSFSTANILSQSQRVINGHPAINNDFPYLVSIRNNRNIHVCGGTIIHEYWILTAAQCFDDKIPEHQMNVIVGTNSGIETPSEQLTYHVLDVNINPNYTTGNLTAGFNVALVKVTRKIIFTPQVQKISPFLGNSEGKLSVKFAGWGSEENTQNQHQYHLTYTSGETISCKNLTLRNNDAEICVVGRSAVCGTDAGGPLVLIGEKDKSLQVGVISTINCSIKNLGYSVSVFTKVASVNQWIRKVVHS